MQYAEEINNSDAISENFYQVYDKIYPYCRHTRIAKTYTIGFLQAVLTPKNHPDIISPTSLLSRNLFLSFTKSQKVKVPFTYSIYLSFALDKYTTPEKCFDYYLNNYDFLYNQVGISKASLWYYKEPISDLTDREIVGLIVMLENPIHFNPIRAPETHERKVNEIINSN